MKNSLKRRLIRKNGNGKSVAWGCCAGVPRSYSRVRNKKTRSCLVISPDELNNHLRTLIVAPMTTSRIYPWRPEVTFQRKKGCIALDQIRTIDKERAVKNLGKVSKKALEQTLVTLRALFEG